MSDVDTDDECFRFEHNSNVFFLISNLFDPRYGFLFFFPMLFSLSNSVGMRALWVTILAEWSNQVLKWVLHGERPYWWVHETGVYNSTSLPAIQQYSMTCETGPGSPSGHVMVTAALWYVLVTSVIDKYRQHKNINLLSAACWCFYATILVAVSMSRVYIAAHFPHQCVLGVVVGIAVARLAGERAPASPSHLTLAAGGLLGSALLTYGSIRAIGLDPMWSVNRAVKWCARREFIHLDTTPFFSMTRYGGFALGLGAGLGSRGRTQDSPATMTRVICACMAVMICRLSEMLVLPKDNLALFYGLAFVLNTLLPVLVVAVVPRVVTTGLAKVKTA
ncbi:G6PC2 [Cordylochernes scorpioides]|uniref:glucose-6-phosphatase n=1 Tax=Cordylochernes scorpioides TaxID=51811 RepID=A0ABY6K3D1_9ARAC|nr:G6PC2 [Cordylochernes scorpioides]